MAHTVLFMWIVFFAKEIHSVEFNVFGNLTHKNEFGCNSRVILQCVVKPKTVTVSWKVGKPVTPTTDFAAQCFGFSCVVDTSVMDVYNFTYDENSGNSNMTINNVTLAEDGKEYSCGDGSSSSSFLAVVQVPPVKETTKISNMTAKTTMITVSTGCVTNRTEQRVSFEWFKIHKNGSVEKFKEASPPSSIDHLPCQINSDCISNGSAALINNFTITEDSKAPEVYFQVHILLDGVFLFFVNTTSAFQPQRLISTSPSSTPNQWNITISTIKFTTTTASLQHQMTVSGGCINSCNCCDCDIKEMFIVIAVAWGSAVILTIVGSCILNYALGKLDLYKCIFQLSSLPWIFLLVVVLLYKGEKKWGPGLVLLLISFLLDAAFIGIDRYYVCLCENVCDIELVDHLWASLIYFMVSAVLSVPKYFILEKCCESESIVSKSNSDLKQKDVRDKHESLPARSLPRISSVSSRLGNEREQEHSLKHVQLMQRSPLPPISTKGHGKSGT